MIFKMHFFNKKLKFSQKCCFIMTLNNDNFFSSKTFILFGIISDCRLLLKKITITILLEVGIFLIFT